MVRVLMFQHLHYHENFANTTPTEPETGLVLSHALLKIANQSAWKNAHGQFEYDAYQNHFSVVLT